MTIDIKIENKATIGVICPLNKKTIEDVINVVAKKESIAIPE